MTECTQSCLSVVKNGVVYNANNIAKLLIGKCCLDKGKLEYRFKKGL